MPRTKYLYNRFTFENGDKGYFARACPGCGYAIEDCALTRGIIICPLCLRTGKEVKLEPCQVTTWPKFSVKRVHLLPSQAQDI